MTLALDLRPKDWAEVIGQDVVVSKCKKLLKGGLPHTILLVGPTGTGKTSVARILAMKLGIQPVEGNPNYAERNCADCRGIDDVREIISDMRFSALGGKNRIWVLDEVVQLPKATQQAMLSMLEEPPPHVYFLLLTTNKSDLLDTIVGRCQVINFKKLDNASLEILMDKAMTSLSRTNAVNPRIISKIAKMCDGSARMALQLLESVLTQSTEESQLEAIGEVVSETLAVDLARALVYNKGWPTVQGVLKSLGQNVETTRRIVLKYVEAVYLDPSPKGPPPMHGRCYQIVNEFKDPWHECGAAGLYAASHRVSQGK